MRREMRPNVRDELDFLFSYPDHRGVMGAVNDSLFAHREVWTDVDALLRYVREMPAGVGELPHRPGIQGLALYTLRWFGGKHAFEARSWGPNRARHLPRRRLAPA